MREQQPRLIEVAPNEWRQVCLVCDTPIKGHGGRLYCEEHHEHKVNSCERCGKGTSGKLCAKCRRESALPGVRAGKRILTERDRPLVEKLWAENLSSPEIAKRIGLSTSHPSQIISHKRTQKGWNLPYRAPWAVEHCRQMAKEQPKKRA